MVPFTVSKKGKHVVAVVLFFRVTHVINLLQFWNPNICLNLFLAVSHRCQSLDIFRVSFVYSDCWT